MLKAENPIRARIRIGIGGIADDHKRQGIS